jgi:hypothetical protein
MNKHEPHRQTQTIPMNIINTDQLKNTNKHETYRQTHACTAATNLHHTGKCFKVLLLVHPLLCQSYII